MPMDRAGAPVHPTRRRAIGLGLAAAATASLSACGIRFEDISPGSHPAARTPVPGEAFMVALWRHTEDLATRAAGAGGTGLPARLAALHRQQATVLQAELLRLGVPDAGPTRSGVTGEGTTGDGATTGTGTATAASASGASPTGSSATGGRTTAAELAAAEAGDLGPTAITSLSRVMAGSVPLVGSVLAQRSAAATLLGRPATWPDEAWKGQSLAATFLTTTRAAVYAFEVVAAQSPTGVQRTLATSTLSTLRARAAAQEAMAGSSAGPPDLAHPLPFPVTTPAAARRLAVDVLTRLRAAGARDLGTAGTDTAALGLLVRWLGETEVLASRWGVPLAPFPGLS
jgi:hypothetical protein